MGGGGTRKEQHEDTQIKRPTTGRAKDSTQGSKKLKDGEKEKDRDRERGQEKRGRKG